MGSSATQHEEPPRADRAALTITDAERVELQRRVRAHTTPQRAAKRARIVLLAADGVPNRQIAAMVGMNEHTVAQWRRRFQAERLAGLKDRKRPGRPLVYDHDQRLRIVATVTQQPPDPASHWSHSQLADELADMGDSNCEASVDEKTGIGARSRTRPTKPVAPGRPARQEHEYLRHGTAILLAALDVHGGSGCARQARRALVDLPCPLLAASTTSQDASSLLVADLPEDRLSW